MAETLTFEQKNEVTSIENLNQDEQDSLQVGEQMQEAEDTRLAGKYENAQELEKAYIELEKKLGEGTAEAKEPEAKEEKTEAKEEKTEEISPTILDELWNQATSDKGEYKQDTLKQLEGMNPGELAKMHLEYRAANVPKDLSDSDIKELKGIVGGDENYSNMLSWAQQNLNETEVNMFDQVMERGDPLAAFFAVRSLAYRYNDAIGFDGKTVTGKPPAQKTDAFRSQAEVVEAMSDPRYEKDSAYRRDIMEKLSRSEVNF